MSERDQAASLANDGMHWLAKPRSTEGIVKCPGICPRYTSTGSDYCCAVCRVSAERRVEPGVLAAGDHPLLSHSVGCDERDQQRRPDAWQAARSSLAKPAYEQVTDGDL